MSHETLSFALAFLLVMVAGMARQGRTPTASDLLSESEATALVGGPLGSTFHEDSPATRENGRDHTTVRGWFPKGWDPDTAEAPPARGVQLTLHAFEAPDDARAFLDRMRSVAEERASAGGPAVLAADGTGEEACALRDTIRGPEDALVGVTTVWFRAGRVFAQLQAWTSDGTDADSARAAARRIAVRLRRRRLNASAGTRRARRAPAAARARRAAA